MPIRHAVKRNFGDATRLALNFNFLFADHKISELRECANEIEQLLFRKSQSLRSHLEIKMKAMHTELADEYAASASEEIQQIEREFPEIFRASLFVMCASAFENIILDVAETLKDGRGHSAALSKGLERGIFKARAHLKHGANVDFPDGELWKEIESLWFIRNLTVHRDGKLARGGKHHQQIEAFVTKWSPIVVFGPNRRLIFSKHFVGRVLKTYEGFLKELRKRCLVGACEVETKHAV